MPVKIPNALPATKVLNGENIFVMTEKRSKQQDIRSLKIAILNLMPTKEQTEIQLLRLIGNTALQVDITLLHTASYESKNVDHSHLKTFYRNFKQVENEYFDGLIITGAPVEKMNFEDVHYWQELHDIMHWAKDHVFANFYICWAAQAALFYRYGINKHELSKKMFGVFKHNVLDQTHKLMRGFDDVFCIPASRHTQINEEDVYNCKDLQVLAVSEESGIGIIASLDGRHIFATGHSEYDATTLADEYFRDKAKGIDIDIPKNYFENDDVNSNINVKWRSAANLLFANWLNYFVYQETPYELQTISKL